MNILLGQGSAVDVRVSAMSEAVDLGAGSTNHTICAISVIAAATFETLEFARAATGSESLNGVSIPAGIVLYNVSKYKLTSGAIAAYHLH